MSMPAGVIADSLAVLIGGALGALAGNRVPKKIRQSLPLVFSVGAMGMGISSLIKMRSTPAVILSLLLGTCIGELIGIEDLIRKVGRKLATVLASGSNQGIGTENMEQFTVAVVLFCTSSLGIYGAMHTSISGDHSILYAKAILDFFTAVIFAASIGFSVSILAVFQAVVLLFFYYLASFLAPVISESMFANLTGCGGLLLLATGIRMAGIKQYAVANMVPAIILIFPISHLSGLVGL